MQRFASIGRWFQGGTTGRGGRTLVSMRAVEVDERDSSWELDEPRYRLYIFDGPGNAVTTIDLVDAELKDVEWSARSLAGDTKLWSAALVVDDSQKGRGLIWLIGGDYNSPPRSAREWRMRDEMQDRYLSNRSLKKLPLALPDGRRVIRLFPDWGREWPLWESFSESYTLSAEDLGLSPGLASDLRSWNAEWQDRSETDPLPPGWKTLGRDLHMRLQSELGSTAEVRPDFDR